MKRYFEQAWKKHIYIDLKKMDNEKLISIAIIYTTNIKTSLS